MAGFSESKNGRFFFLGRKSIDDNLYPYPNNESQKSTTTEKKREGKKNELHSTKGSAGVRFAMQCKTVCFLANGNPFVRLRKKILPVSVV